VARQGFAVAHTFTPYGRFGTAPAAQPFASLARPPATCLHVIFSPKKPANRGDKKNSLYLRMLKKTALMKKYIYVALIFMLAATAQAQDRYFIPAQYYMEDFFSEAYKIKSFKEEAQTILDKTENEGATTQIATHQHSTKQDYIQFLSDTQKINSKNIVISSQRRGFFHYLSDKDSLFSMGAAWQVFDKNMQTLMEYSSYYKQNEKADTSYKVSQIFGDTLIGYTKYTKGKRTETWHKYYDSNGRIIKELFWGKENRPAYKAYNYQGDSLTITITDANLITTIAYKFAANNKPIFIKKSQDGMYSIYTYAYNDKNQLIKAMIQHGEKKYNEYLYKYGSNDKIKTQINYQTKFDYRTKFDYQTELKTSSTTTVKVTTNFTYDKKQNIVKSITKFGAKNQVSFTENYYYDKEGKLLKQTDKEYYYRNFNTDIPPLVRKNTTDFEYIK
jgi:hypothetical protein